MEHANDTDLKKAEWAMCEVTNIVMSIQQLCSDACQSTADNAEATAQITAIRHLTDLAGYHADLAISKIGNDPGVYGNAEGWLCSPAYKSLSQQPAALD